MSSLLYYSISSDLTKAKKIEIDERVAKKRDAVYIFVKNFFPNGKGKTKKIIFISTFGLTVWLSNVKPFEAIGLPIRPVPVVRVDKPSYDYGSKIKVAPAVTPKVDKMTFIMYRELPVRICMMDERFLNTPETRKLIKELRGGSLLGTAAALVLIIFLWQIMGVGEGF